MYTPQQVLVFEKLESDVDGALEHESAAEGCRDFTKLS
jgi:hypothetical protein